MARGQTEDRKGLAKQREREQREVQQQMEDLAEVMAMPAGRRFIYRLLFDTCDLQSIYVAQDSGIYKHEGRRSVGFALAQELQRDHAETYILMITERMRDLRYANQIREEPKTETGDDT